MKIKLNLKNSDDNNKPEQQEKTTVNRSMVFSMSGDYSEENDENIVAETRTEVSEDGTVTEITTYRDLAHPDYTKTCICCGKQLHRAWSELDDFPITSPEELLTMEINSDEPQLPLMCPDCKCVTLWTHLELSDEDITKLREFVSGETYQNFLRETADEDPIIQLWTGLYNCMMVVGYYDLAVFALKIVSKYAFDNKSEGYMELLSMCFEYSKKMAQVADGYEAYVFSIIALDCLLKVQDWEVAKHYYEVITEFVEQYGLTKDDLSPLQTAECELNLQMENSTVDLMMDIFLDADNGIAQRFVD